MALLLGFAAPCAVAQRTAVSSVVFTDGEASDGGSSDDEVGTQSGTAGARTFNAGTGFASASVTPDPLAGVVVTQALPNLHVDAAASDSGLGADDTAMATFTDSNFSFMANEDDKFSAVTCVFHVSGSLTGASGANFDFFWGGTVGSGVLTGGTQTIRVIVQKSSLSRSTVDEGDGITNLIYSGTLEESLSAFANAGGSESGISSTSSEADYKDTIQLAEIDVTDADGNPIAETFYDTNSDGSAGPISFAANTNLIVPEPETAVLLAPALVLLALIGWRRVR